MTRPCYYQQNHAVSQSIKGLHEAVSKSACVVALASNAYIQNELRGASKTSELRAVSEACSASKKTLVVIAMDSSSYPSLRQLGIKPSQVLVWGSANFWQLIGAQLPQRSSTLKITNSKLYMTMTGTSKKPSSTLVDDEMWTYLKGNSKLPNLPTSPKSDKSKSPKKGMSMDTIHLFFFSCLKVNMP